MFLRPHDFFTQGHDEGETEIYGNVNILSSIHVHQCVNL